MIHGTKYVSKHKNLELCAPLQGSPSDPLLAVALKGQPVQLYTTAGQPAQHRGSQALIRNVRGKQDVAILAWHPTLPLLVVAWRDGELPCDTHAMRLASASDERAERKTAAWCKLCLSQLAMQVMLARHAFA